MGRGTAGRRARGAVLATGLAAVLAAMLAAGLAAPLPAQEPGETPAIADSAAEPASSPSPPPPVFTRTHALLAAGFVAGTLAAMPLDEPVKDRIQETAVRERLAPLRDRPKLLNSPQTLKLSGAVYVAGLATRQERVATVGLRSLESIVVSGVATGGLQWFFGRARPYRNLFDSRDFKLGRGYGREPYNAMPSGHTTAAFAVAGAATAQLAEWWPRAAIPVGVILYTDAALIGAWRVWYDQHWVSDVVLAAGIGTLSGIGVVRWHQRNRDTWFDRVLLPDLVFPRGDGVEMVWTFSAP
jgi:membrane-associated phospholipid phosphatase